MYTLTFLFSFIKQVSQVYRWKKKFAEDENPFSNNRNGRCGRKYILNDNDVNNIVDLVTNNPFSSAKSVIDRLNLHCTRQTVWKRLKGRGLNCRRPARKVEFTAQHAASRFAFAETNMLRNWQNVIFSDEKVFSSDIGSRKPLYRLANTRYEEQNLLKTKRSGRICLSLWGWMSAAGPGELVRTGPRMNAEEYVRILETVMIPSVRAIYGEMPIIFVQDNSAVHTSRLVRNWFVTQPQVTLLDWPAKSPDLNPIENLWADVVRRWDDFRENDRIRTADQLYLHATRIWESYRGRDICQTLVNSMERRLQETIDNIGFWTKY